MNSRMGDPRDREKDSLNVEALSKEAVGRAKPAKVLFKVSLWEGFHLPTRSILRDPVPRAPRWGEVFHLARGMVRAVEPPLVSLSSKSTPE